MRAAARVVLGAVLGLSAVAGCDSRGSVDFPNKQGCEARCVDPKRAQAAVLERAKDELRCEPAHIELTSTADGYAALGCGHYRDYVIDGCTTDPDDDCSVTARIDDSSG